MGNWKRVAAIAVIATIAIAIVGFIFSKSLHLIVGSWQEEEYSYGYFVPLLALSLLAQRLNSKTLVVKGSWGWLFFTAATLFVGIVCTASDINGILPHIFILFLFSVVLSVFGARQFLYFLGPLVYLGFCAPIPRFLFADVSFHLQLMSTNLSAYVVDLLGYPIYVEGNVIDLGGYKLQVVEACSGLRYLFPLISFSFLIAYLTRAHYLIRTIIFLSAIPITVLMNSLRIAIIAVTVNLWGDEMAGGFLHFFEGWVVFLACLALLFLEVGLFHLMKFKIETNVSDLFPSSVPSIRFQVQSLKTLFATTALVLLAFGTCILIQIFPVNQPAPVVLANTLKTFPTDIDGWRGTTDTLSRDVLDLLNLDDYLLIDYKKPANEQVNFYAAYYAHQDSTAAYHSPSICLPAGGWEVQSNRHHVIAVNGSTFTVNRWIIKKGSLRELVFYWFDQRGAILTDDYQVKLHILADALRRKNTNGALVRVTTPIADNETEEIAEARLIGFLSPALPVLHSFLYGSAR